MTKNDFHLELARELGGINQSLKDMCREVKEIKNHLATINCRIDKIEDEVNGMKVKATLMTPPPDLDDNNRPFLAADYAAAVTTLAVDNGNKFAVNDYVVIGRIGGEKTEIVKVSAVAAASINTDSTVFAHNRGERITFIPYNQI